MDFNDLIVFLNKYEVDGVLLPFILIFTIFYAILQKTKILGDRKPINITVSVALGLGFIFPHFIPSYSGTDPVEFLNSFLPYSSLVIVIAFSFLLTLSVVGFNPLNDLKQSFPFIILFAILFNLIADELYPLLAPVVLIITIFIAIMILIIKPETNPNAVPMWLILSIILIILGMIAYIYGWTDIPPSLMFMTKKAFKINLIIIAVVVLLMTLVVKDKKDEDK